MNIKKIAAIGASVTLFLATTGIAFADTTITVSGNGDSSNTTVGVTNDTTDTVGQSVVGSATNVVTNEAETGGNRANRNTGGAVTVTSGNATAMMDALNGGSLNEVLSDCGCVGGGSATIAVQNNGAGSTQVVGLVNRSSRVRSQGVAMTRTNVVTNRGRTGGNRANRNTNGTVNLTSGSSTADTVVTNEGDINSVVDGSVAE